MASSSGDIKKSYPRREGIPSAKAIQHINWIREEPQNAAFTDENEGSSSKTIVLPDFKHHVIANPAGKVQRESGPSHIVKYVPKDRNCADCSTPNIRKRTNYICKSYNAFLHPKDCFENFHEKK